MYNTNNYSDGYCLLSHFTRDAIVDRTDGFKLKYHAYSYCLRQSDNISFMIDSDFKNTVDSNFTFAKLKEENITSQMLLSWSASLDLAERYQIFLNNRLNPLSESEVLFYNCTSSWFGPFCRFTFDYKMDKTFEDIVAFIFKSKIRVNKKNVKVTCYEHHHCQTLLSCLDWREICDGKNDCLDGSDENNCWQLEVNECAKDEYRCHNGQCIPIEFLHNAPLHPDCLDRTDEDSNDNYDLTCPNDPSFRCEEHTCRPGNAEFSCGDGECTNGIYRCYNGRNSLLPIDFCSNATACSMGLTDQVDTKWCKKFCSKTSCRTDNCEMIYEFRYIPILFGHVRFMYSNKEFKSDIFSLPDYVCYDEKLCADFLPATTRFHNLTCRQFNDLGLNDTDLYYNVETLVKYMKKLFRTCLIVTSETHYCDYSTMYRCENSSKCIAKQRLLDGIQDCPFNDDETFNQSCSLSDIHQRFNCSDDDNVKCFASLVIRDLKKDCQYGEDESNEWQQTIGKHISFQTICDGKIELLPMLINGQLETDETDCEHWQCNNTYSRCDGFWLCKDGADEVNCPRSTCPKHHHSCVFPNDTSNISCLPIAQAGNGIDDCLGGTDERRKYRVNHIFGTIIYDFHCWNDTKYIDSHSLCDKTADCQFNDDEVFCKSIGFEGNVFCHDPSSLRITDVERFLCRFVIEFSRPRIVNFKLRNIPTYSLQLTTKNNSITPSTWTKNRLIVKDPIEYISSEDAWFCNRGVPIRLRMSGNISELFCLCPPSYYGDRCQYQNQRVSLSLQIRALSDWHSAFIFLITLIDNERNIESHDQIEYLPIRDCKNKFNIYLLYSTRPKNLSKNYSVQIDAFNQITLTYRVSWIFPLRFPFLPVHRLSVLLKVPFSNMGLIQQKCWPKCLHGQCFPYVNDQNSTFCHCESGWSGVQCDIKYLCDCAPDSLCRSKSICLCPPGRFGSRCHLFQFSCHSESCQNGGKCVSIDARFTYGYSNKSTCICPEGYIGDHCEHRQKQSRIDISFHHKVTIPSSLLIHFIDTQTKDKHNKTSIMKKIGFDQYSLTVYTTVLFNIAFAQISTTYYLIILHEQTIVSSNISTEVIPSHRCRSIGELFNETFANQHLLKRIKYYHIPCQKQPELLCFHDDVHFCLCDLSHQANCFEFDHNMTYNCGGHNFCENNGHCFQDDPKCPTPPNCACHQCYFGSTCKFTTKGSILSLDTILGYHIRSKSGINQQPIIVKVAIALTTFIFVCGLVNSFLSFQTFRGKETRTVGCGLYLFASSIITMITMIVFTLKFSFFLASQIGSINNRSFINVQCVSIDFLLRFLLSTSDWLSACVAIERTVTVSKGVNFDKSKSKLMAKWMIFIVLLFTSCTYIYDPLYRRLIDDEEEQRTWCVSQYSSSVQIFDRILNIFHFSVPFALNCLSALLIIITAARSRLNSQKTKSFKEHLREQIRHHKHLLISPCILIGLAVPRLMISFLSGCMESARDASFYIIGYFISFIPPITTFIVFVLPSEMYKKEFSESMKHICQR